MRRLAQRLERLIPKAEPMIRAKSGINQNTVYGVVDKVVDGVEHCVRKWRGSIGDMVPTDEEPTIFIAEKLEPLILKYKKYKGIYGGRAGTKSIMGMSCMVGDVNENGSKVFVLREKMKTLEHSVYAGMVSIIGDLGLSGFLPVPSNFRINHKSGGLLSFGGLKNVDDLKSFFQFKFFMIEEAHATTDHALKTLGPTLRGIKGAEMWLMWNPKSSTDPMSKRFINPFKAQLDATGYYEDKYRIIIKTTYKDNPWFEGDETLSTELAMNLDDVDKDIMSQAEFDHIWLGEFNDEIEGSIIKPEWFDACVDAHVKLGIKPFGARVAAYDPADIGKDAKGLSMRHDVVVEYLNELSADDGNEGFDIACDESKKYGVDSFGWDACGMGALFRRQAVAQFNGTKINSYMYRASDAVHMPDAIFEHCDDYNIKGGTKNKDVFENRNAQSITLLAKRFKNTWLAVKKGAYIDPKEIISFDSSKISKEMLAQLRLECRMPVKPADTIKFYTKKERAAGILQSNGEKLVLLSPNLFDTLLTLFDPGCHIQIDTTDTTRRPKPRKTMGKR